MNEVQEQALRNVCARYGKDFDADKFTPAFDLPEGYVAGWIGEGLYVGCAPDGAICS